MPTLLRESGRVRLLLTPDECQALARGETLEVPGESVEILPAPLPASGLVQTIEQELDTLLTPGSSAFDLPRRRLPAPGEEIRCGRCHQRLTHPDSRVRGYGPICWAKVIIEAPTDIQEKLRQLDALRQEVRETGEVDEVEILKLMEQLREEPAGRQAEPGAAPAQPPAPDPDEDEAPAVARLPLRDPEPDMAWAEHIFRDIFAQHMTGYEPRAPQIHMAREVARALATGSHLVSEAGTGTGKSFALLVPAIHWARQIGKPVLISTGTIALQEQYMGKDIPFLQKVLADVEPFQAALVKGKGNYLCRLRFDEELQQQGLLQDPEFGRLATWARHTETGDKSDMDWIPPEAIWNRVNVDDSCTKRDCPHYSYCHFFKAKRAAQEADILVCNHHLFLADLATGGFVLPRYGALLLDEAHHVEEIASEAFGVEMSQFRIPALLRELERLGHPDMPGDLIAQLREVTRDHFEWYARYAPVGSDRKPQPLDRTPLSRIPAGDDEARVTAGHILPLLERLLEAVGQLDWAWANERTRKKSEKLQDRLSNLMADWTSLYWPADEIAARFVAWVEVDRSRKDRDPRVTLHLNPISVAPEFREMIWEPIHSVTCTSATISTGATFEYFKKQTGLDQVQRQVHELQVDSPFDYSNQALLYVPRGLPDPSDGRWGEAIIPAIRDVLQASNGRAFVLFTSYRNLDQAHKALAAELEAAGHVVLRQGDMPRAELVETFKAIHQQGRSPILFATGTFWEGISIEGEALSVVLIDKLPFSVPTDPIAQAKVDAIKKAGGNEFMEYTVPQAVIRLKQGFGRLIRTQTDKGLVAILDNRLRTKPYGRVFLRSLPPAREIFHLGDVPAFLGKGAP